MSGNAYGLYDYQLEALNKMHNGCILCGGVGSGKSRTALAYYFKENGGYTDKDYYIPMSSDGPGEPLDLYIITTAHKRDTLEWEGELTNLLLYPEMNLYSNSVVVDSWNNIKKYTNVTGAFFIFDEQRVVGTGAWVKAFLKITKSNKWILLSATPGDTWSDYGPVFVANGYYRNITQFRTEHIVYKYIPGASYRPIDRYISQNKLRRLRDETLVTMSYKRPAEVHEFDISVTYNSAMYREVMKFRWNPWTDEPIENVSALCYTLRKVINSADARQLAILEILQDHPKAIIFYNYDYELEILKSMPYFKGTEIAQLNGHQHDPVPTGDRWVYLVNYNAGAEGWNCITTDTMIFYSQNYSYRIMTQSKGRIDRVNTKFTDLYYYHLKSKAPIDLAIGRALKAKRNFNESSFTKRI